MRAFSKPMRRVSSSMRPAAMAAVGLPKAAGAADGDAALGAGLQVDGGVARASRDEKASGPAGPRSPCGKRRALAHHVTTAKPCSALMTALSSPSGALKTLISTSLATADQWRVQRDVLVVVEDGGLQHAHALRLGDPDKFRGANLEPVRSKR